MIPENTLTEEAKNEFNKIREIKKNSRQRNRTNEYTYSFKNFQAIKNFRRVIYNCTITLKEADKDQSSLLVEIMNFKSKLKNQNPEKKDILKNLHALFDGRERILDAFERGIFPIKIEGTGFSDIATQGKVSDHSNLKI